MAKPWGAWRIIREIDLEAVRAEAERAFRVLVLAESRRDAEDLAALLSGSPKADPWLVVAQTGAQPVPVPLPDVAVLASRDPDLSPRLGMSAQCSENPGSLIEGSNSTVVAGLAPRLDRLTLLEFPPTRDRVPP